MILFSFLAIAMACVAVAVASYRMGRADERRAHELRDHIMRVIGGDHA